MIVPCDSCHSTFQLDSRLVKSTGTKVRCSNCQEIFRVYPPSAVNRRKHPRVKTQNLISYFAFDKNGKKISHGLGIALDISKGGILLETPNSIESGFLVLTATDKKKNVIEAKGRLIYSKRTSSETYLCGIEFIGNDKRVTDFITKLIKEFNVQKNNLFITLKKKVCRKKFLSKPHIHTNHMGKSDKPDNHSTKNIRPTNDFEEMVKNGATEYAGLPDIPEIEEIVDSILDERDHISNISPHIQAKYCLTQNQNFSEV